MEWNVLKLLQWSEGFLRDKGIESPRLDAELLLARSLGMDRVQLYVQFDRPLREEELAAFKILLKRRAGREPLAYILGEREFFSLPIKVNPSVLVPRPETEELVERALSRLRARDNSASGAFRILDLATGTGCLLLALLKNLPAARGVGLDISAAALATAADNAARLETAERVSWLEADLARNWAEKVEGPFDLITANPPYVAEAEWAALAPEVRDFEPKAALVPGPEGIESFSWILPHLAALLKPDGCAFLEIGWTQGERLVALAERTKPDFKAEIFKDLAGKDRIFQWSPGD